MSHWSEWNRPNTSRPSRPSRSGSRRPWDRNSSRSAHARRCCNSPSSVNVADVAKTAKNALRSLSRMATTTARTTGFVRSSALICPPVPTPSPDEPAASVRHEDRERHDGRLELAGSRAGECLRYAHPFDRDDLIRIGPAVRRATILREEEVQRPFEVRGQVVPGVHLEKPLRLEARLLQELAAGTRLRALAVLRGAAG